MLVFSSQSFTTIVFEPKIPSPASAGFLRLSSTGQSYRRHDQATFFAILPRVPLTRKGQSRKQLVSLRRKQINLWRIVACTSMSS